MGRSNRTRTAARQPVPTDQGASAARSESPVEVGRRSYWQGPLPPPAVLEDFGRLVPDAPERIFRQWEMEADHRRTYERQALDAAIRRDVRGQASALVFAVAALSVSAFALWLGQPWVAGTIGGGTIASVVGAFLFQRATAKSNALPQSPGDR